MCKIIEYVTIAQKFFNYIIASSSIFNYFFVMKEN